MTKHRKQHYISRGYLEPWCDPRCPAGHTPYIWVFSRDGSKSRKKAPENIFYEKDMYTIHLEDGTRDLRLEHGLSELETLFSQVKLRKIDKQESLTPEDKVILCAFAAAMQARTRSQRELHQKQWGRVLEMMDSMKKAFEKASPEQKKRMALFSSTSSNDERSSFSHDDVRRLAKNPLQNTLPSMIKVATPLLYKLDMSILLANSEIGFITSDDPCVWFDPEAYKRRPFYRSPALMYKTIEITLPISPRATLFLNRQGVSRYIAINEKLEDNLNSRTRYYAHEYFAVNADFKKDAWFDVGVEPDDSWEKTQKKSKGKDAS